MASAPLPRRDNPSILLVEDDPSLLQLLSELLQSAGWKVIPASSGYQALTLFEQRSHEIDFFVSDVVMPQLFGDQLIRYLLHQKPTLKYVLMSGNPPASLETEIPLEEGKNFLRKPFSLADLRAALDQQGEPAAR